MLSLRIDPWAAEYEGAVQLDGDDEPQPDEVDVEVEGIGWQAVDPPPVDQQPTVHFVDGIRRVDLRVLLASEGETVYGLFGSVAVGAVRADRERAAFHHRRVTRFLVLGSGLSDSDWRIPAGKQELVYRARSARANTPTAPMLELQELMRGEEAELGRELAQQDGAVVLTDGPLYFDSARAPAVGFVKRLYKRYLSPEQAALLPQLRAGQRTPLFALTGGMDRYSWYQRLAEPRPIDHGLAGVVRLEAPASLGVERARELADLMAARLPSFASTARHDPRAPQNLFPVGALERDLRHHLGDATWVRRAIEAAIYRAQLLETEGAA